MQHLWLLHNAAVPASQCNQRVSEVFINSNICHTTDVLFVISSRLQATEKVFTGQLHRAPPLAHKHTHTRTTCPRPLENLCRGAQMLCWKQRTPEHCSCCKKNSRKSDVVCLSRRAQTQRDEAPRERKVGVELKLNINRSRLKDIPETTISQILKIFLLDQALM